MTSWGDSLARLFAAYHARLEAFISRRTGDPQIAADLTQEAFLRLARLPDAEKVENASGYLFTVAGNLAQDHRRRAIRWRRLDGGPADEQHPSAEPDAEGSSPVPRRRAGILRMNLASYIMSLRESRVRSRLDADAQTAIPGA